VEDDKVVDPTFGEDNDIKRKAKQLGLILQHFRSRWRYEYLTSLREFHRESGNNNQRIAVRDVVLVHDDCKRIYWELAIIESLIYGKDNLTRAAINRTANGKASQAITKLYPLEIRSSSEFSSKDPSSEQCESTNVEESECNENRPQRDAARHTRFQTKLWCDDIHAPPKDVEDW